jgi:hypothetical protein
MPAKESDGFTVAGKVKNTGDCLLVACVGASGYPGKQHISVFSFLTQSVGLF